ncbi:MAG TPA: hypothetical protein PKA64_25465, partial [Myxococcota bacterium]|nr:hypothetical protein [Myxococcota bacterium]
MKRDYPIRAPRFRAIGAPRRGSRGQLAVRVTHRARAHGTAHPAADPSRANGTTHAPLAPVTTGTRTMTAMGATGSPFAGVHDATSRERATCARATTAQTPAREQQGRARS